MILIIHLRDGLRIQINDTYTQEQVEALFKYLDQATSLHFLEKNGKNHIIPVDKIIYIETKFKL